MNGLTRLTLGLLACGVCVSAQSPPAPTVRLVSPIDGSYATGPTPILAEIDPPEAIASVTFSVDGRQVCSVTRPPFVCDWDAGASIEEHQIRLVANLAAGGRIVRTSSTKALEYVDAVSVDVVQLTAVVTNGGRFVRALPKDAFRIFEDDTPQTITSFSSENIPLELVVAVDMSTSVTPAMPQIRAALREFLGAIAPADHVTLLGFNSSIYTLTRRETDPARRIKAVDALEPSGATVLNDVIIHSVDLLSQQTGRKVLVVFSDGEDQGSNAALQDVEDRLRGSDVTLFMIGAGRGLQIDALKKGMVRLSEPTGGRAFFTEKIEELHELFVDLRAELSNQYLLGYASTNAARDGTWRKVKIETPGRGQVRTREGYRAPKQ
jgi:VWFA-related protein